MMEESRADATLEAEIYRPDFGGGAGVWAMAAKSGVARLYHSVALLVPDGRVITAGSNPARKTEELRIEVFWPPYLFAGPRPTCNRRHLRSATGTQCRRPWRPLRLRPPVSSGPEPLRTRRTLSSG
jgi:hypothetical protein